MSDGGTGEKTEQPTPERLRKLRREGNVPKSQDVTSAVSFLVVFVALAASFGFVGEQMIDLLHTCILAASAPGEIDTAVVGRVLDQGLIAMAKSVAPVLGAALVVGLVMNVAQVGFIFTLKPVTPDLAKINPVEGFKNLVNKKKVVELLKTLVKFVVVASLSYVALRDAIRDVVLILRSDLFVGLRVVGSIIWDFCIEIGGAFVIVAAFDFFYQRRKYIKDNMMSKYDVKQEYKQSEGDPRHKAERRRLHQEIINSVSPAVVEEADVVICNPEHVAVALKYDKERGGAPRVVAKGNRIWAEKILATARQAGVPIVRNVPLAHALNRLELGEDIPEELYEAVAEVLNFVYSLAEEQKRKRGK